MPNCIQCGRRMPGLTFGKKVCQWCRQYEAAQRAEAAGVEPDAVQPVMTPPWMQRERALPVSLNYLFLGINVAVFVGMVLAGVSITDPSAAQLVHWGGNFGPLTFGSQPWRLLTSCFIHAGIIHIGFNMWCLWDLGALAEMLYGPWTFAGVYLVSGVASMLASAAWRFGGVSVGASGAIFGLAGALAASFYLGEFSLPRQAIMGQFRSLVLFVVYNLAFGAVAGHIDNAAHIGGLVMGGILGALIARVAPDRTNWPRRMAILGAALAVVIAGTFAFQRLHAYDAHVANGADLLRNKQSAAALAEFQSAARIRPSSTAAYYGLAQVHSDLNNWPAAEADLKRIIELQPNDPEAYYELGWAYHEDHQPDAARATFLKLLQLDPQSAEGHLGLGIVFSDQKNDREAIEQYEAAASLNPRLEEVNYDLGLALARLGDYDNAIEAFRREIEISGEQSDTEAALAKAYRSKGMTAEAEAAERKVSKAKPETH